MFSQDNNIIYIFYFNSVNDKLLDWTDFKQTCINCFTGHEALRCHLIFKLSLLGSLDKTATLYLNAKIKIFAGSVWILLHMYTKTSRPELFNNGRLPICPPMQIQQNTNEKQVSILITIYWSVFFFYISVVYDLPQ